MLVFGEDAGHRTLSRAGLYAVRRARPSQRRLPRIGFQVEAGRAPVGRAARSSLEERRAV